MLHDNVQVNEQNHLTFAGVDTTVLAKKYGTPLMLLDTNKIRENILVYKTNIEKYFPKNSTIFYASKALSLKEIYRIAKDEKIGIDVVSIGEIFTAKSVDFPLERAMFHGNNKTDFDIKFAIENGVGYFVADNKEELIEINNQAKNFNIKQKVLYRYLVEF